VILYTLAPEIGCQLFHRLPERIERELPQRPAPALAAKPLGQRRIGQQPADRPRHLAHVSGIDQEPADTIQDHLFGGSASSRHHREAGRPGFQEDKAEALARRAPAQAGQ
jgi:hypothetical protein